MSTVALPTPPTKGGGGAGSVADQDAGLRDRAWNDLLQRNAFSQAVERRRNVNCPDCELYGLDATGLMPDGKPPVNRPITTRMAHGATYGAAYVPGWPLCVRGHPVCDPDAADAAAYAAEKAAGA